MATASSGGGRPAGADPTSPARLVLATHNAHKVRELTEILGQFGPIPDGAVVGAGDLGLPDVPETGVTFRQNALLKARAVAQYTGLAAVADDSGLCVEAFGGGAPGVFSARWAGRHGDDEANLRLLLAQLADLPDPDRGAWFECAAALVWPDGRELVETGRMSGRLATAPRGSGGFGYDPILIPDGYQVTSAELTGEAKNAISHRGAALRALAPHIMRILAG